ncbi:hypothetical protein CLM62_33115 [Streptomyces sp. SA15]|uniref:hypothetical protein n=1 Tax=Streptomyces sp. SA15 TaxID=934019 RepID=UPI000BB02777|nr:hypothetical protein [Streptomyces sp. SA15]PAZ11957.1 hypothetical protein CLM62_33115 [Streptomyces sp. SA15]
MHGHGYTQPVKQPPPTAWLVFLRVLFVAISIFSIGLLAWTMLLRLAIVTRKSLDWGLLVAALVADFLALVLVGTESGDEVHTVGGWTGMALLLGTLVASIAYYLAADIRHFHQLRYGGYAPQPGPTPGYGFPQPASPSPYTATTVPQTPQTPQKPQPPQPPLPTTPPPPQRPAPARIDQVRAELDELSDYLRRQDGNHEGGR